MKANCICLYGFRQQMLIQPKGLPDPPFNTVAIYGPAEQLFWSNKPKHATFLRIFIHAVPTQQGRFLDDG